MSLEYLPLAQHIGATWWFPLIESLHVVSITLMLGAILMVDLRVLGLAATRYSVSTLSRELVPWSAVALGVASVTGIAMFITRASAHAVNPAFQIKMLLMVLAGINVAVFHLIIFRHNVDWDPRINTSVAARLVAASSIALWIGVMLAGRWVGHIV
ncbi:MAG: hypothetical protein Q7V56_05440 [Gammaproteobacteria bacterium]|nr:hypothetical protein [Gammaproteobacteria bacterium]